MFAISKCQKWYFIISYSSIVIAATVIAISKAFRIDSLLYLRLIGGGVAGLLYLVLSIYAMIVFAHKMYRLFKIPVLKIAVQN